MPINIITFTLDHQPEDGIVENFLNSVVRAYIEEDQYPWLVTTVNKEQMTDLIDEFTSMYQIGEDQRGELVSWLNGLDSDDGTFIAIAER